MGEIQDLIAGQTDAQEPNLFNKEAMHTYVME
jgi:hypothetical protein